MFTGNWSTVVFRCNNRRREVYNSLPTRSHEKWNNSWATRGLTCCEQQSWRADEYKYGTSFCSHCSPAYEQIYTYIYIYIYITNLYLRWGNDMKRWLQNCGLDVDPTRSNPMLSWWIMGSTAGAPWPFQVLQSLDRELVGLSWGLINVNGTQPLVIQKNRKDSVDRHIKWYKILIYIDINIYNYIYIYLLILI